MDAEGIFLHTHTPHPPADPDRPPPTCNYGGTHPNCNPPTTTTQPPTPTRPPPTCNYGGTWPFCNLPPTTTTQPPTTTRPPPTCNYGGTWPFCNLPPTTTTQPPTTTTTTTQPPPTCNYGGTWPFCNSAPVTTTTTTPATTTTTVPTIDTTCANVDPERVDACREAITEGYRLPDEAEPEPVDSAERLRQMGDQFDEANGHIDFDEDAYQAALPDSGRQPPRRGEMAEALCAGIPDCNANNLDEAIQYLIDNDLTVADSVEDFGAEGQLINGHVSLFFHRIVEEQTTPGYTPPVGHTTTNGGPPGPGCDSGLTVIQSHVGPGDDGCRPPSCDFRPRRRRLVPAAG